MTTEISIHAVDQLEIEAIRLDEPAPDVTVVKIRIGATGVGGGREWQIITLFFQDRPGERFEDSDLANKITAFNSSPELTMKEVIEGLG